MIHSILSYGVYKKEIVSEFNLALSQTNIRKTLSIMCNNLKYNNSYPAYRCLTFNRR